MAKKKMSVKGRTKPPLLRPSSDFAGAYSKQHRDAIGLRGQHQLGNTKNKVKLRSGKRKKK